MWPGDVTHLVSYVKLCAKGGVETISGAQVKWQRWWEHLGLLFGQGKVGKHCSIETLRVQKHFCCYKCVIFHPLTQALALSCSGEWEPVAFPVTARNLQVSWGVPTVQRWKMLLMNSSLTHFDSLNLCFIKSFQSSSGIKPFTVHFPGNFRCGLCLTVDGLTTLDIASEVGANDLADYY